jgi:hypothetical protein
VTKEATVGSLAGRLRPKVWIVHTAYDVVSGLWPLVGIESFQKVSGRKTDIWLVKTVALLVLAIGATIGAAGARRRITPEVAGLAIGSSMALAVIDVAYVGKDRISRVYLLDALANALLIAGWLLAWRRGLLAAHGQA